MATSKMRVLHTMTINFKDGRAPLVIPASDLQDFSITNSGSFLYIQYKPVITHDEKDHFEFKMNEQWFRIDEIESMTGVLKNRRWDRRDIFEYKRDNANEIKQWKRETKEIEISEVDLAQAPINPVEPTE
jgi:hypothetical protein